MLGWLVIVLRRHAEALHDLVADEWAEFGELQRRTVQVLAAETGCAKEYLALFAEKPGFRHLHQHVVAVPAALPDDLRGTKIFARINPAPADVVPPAEMAAFCARLVSAFAAA
jgi:diadenosine tetraphosphate (Ap4A) HIT family hydrolase